jgi:hypothetical protein
MLILMGPRRPAEPGRFASQDPVPGGNANTYAYALDPINFADLTGLSSGCAILCISLGPGGLQGGVGAKQLQPTVSSSQVVHSVAKTSSIKVAASTARAQAPQNTTPAPAPVSSIAPAGPPPAPFRNFTPAQIGTTGPSTPQTTQVSGSACLVAGCIEIGLAYDGGSLPHLSIGAGLGLEFGVSATVGGGPGTVNTGWNGQLSCSAGLLNGSLTSDGNDAHAGLSGGVNVVPGEAGCNAGGSYTW